MDEHFLTWTKNARFIHLREDYYKYRFDQLHDEHYPNYPYQGRYWTMHRLGYEKFDIKTFDLIKLDWESPVAYKIRDYKQRALDTYLAFIGKSREQYFEELGQEIRASVRASHERIAKQREEEERRKQEEEDVRRAAEQARKKAEWDTYMGVGTWRYPVMCARLKLERVWHKFDVHVIFPVRCKVDRRFREKWTRIAGIHQEFKAAQQEQFRRWDEEREHRKILNAMVETTITRNSASLH
ncbi:hypothetical protein SD80_012565 [Scytonema tolypothrichoides VB-61278]|nr:hypothetical protein SD80_012565 [Scytonema tolypothrichoides VB-61278]